MAQLGTIKVQTDSGIVDVPVFDVGDSGGSTSEALRVQTDSGEGFVPLVDPADASNPQEAIRVQTDSGVKAVTDSAGGLPDSAVVSLNARKISTTGSISQWNDQTSNNNNVAGSGSVETNGINGFQCVRFDGTSDGFRASFPPISQKVVVISVIQSDSTTPTGDVNTIAAPDSNRSRMGSPAFFGGGNNGAYHIDAGSSGFSTGSENLDAHVITGVFDGSNTTLRVDGTVVLGPSSFGSNDWDGLSVGQDPSSTSEDGFFDGFIGAIEMHDGSVSVGLSTRESEIGNQFGLSV
jgi:hypothetical protein